MGDFATLNKKVNQIYVTNKSGQRRELRGPSSPIGDRYLDFHCNGRGEFGIHGTAWPQWVQIGAAVSLGSVRMLNTHMRQLFDAVDVDHAWRFAVDQASGRTVSKISFRISPAP